MPFTNPLDKFNQPVDCFVRRSLRVWAVLLVAQLWLVAPVPAADLGKIGPTYPIVEKDLVEVMKNRLRRMEKSGELGTLQEKYKQQVIGAVEHPRPVPGIKSTETARTHYIDPTWVLERTMTDAAGKILFPAGTRVNPFDYDRLSKNLLFFDQSDPRQVEFAKRYIASSSIPVKPILVGGEPMKLMREWKREVFFDQGGKLSRRFAITQTPAIVSQEEKKLRVDAIKI